VPEQLCPACLAQANAPVVIPATCSTHPEVAGVVARIEEGWVELESHIPGGCTLRMQASLLFDVLGEWWGEPERDVRPPMLLLVARGDHSNREPALTRWVTGWDEKTRPAVG
jgi:hypothetical protein